MSCFMTYTLLLEINRRKIILDVAKVLATEIRIGALLTFVKIVSNDSILMWDSINKL